MKEKVAIHLETLTANFLVGVDFRNLAKIGPKNIRAVINFLKDNEGGQESRIEEEENKLLSFKNDVMEVERISSYINYLRIRLGNRKLLLANLKTALSHTAKDIDLKYPVLPVLRRFDCFKTGDDVMVYVGKIGLESESKKADEVIISPFDWVCGKVLSYLDSSPEYTVSVFINNKYSSDETTSLDGHYRRIMAMSPTIFKRDEFYAIKEMLENNKNPEFIKLFFENAKYSPYRYKIESWPDYEEMKKIILNSKIEQTSDEELLKNEKALIESILEIAKKHSLYVQNTREMAKMKGFKIE